MRTSFWWRVSHLISGRPVFPAEFRAERMDANWRPEYLAMRGHDAPSLGTAIHLLYR